MRGIVNFVIGQTASLVTVWRGLELPLVLAILVGIALAAIPAYVMHRLELRAAGGS